jgi:hypothetical protein
LRRKLFRIPQWTSESESDSDADEDVDANDKSAQGHPDPLLLLNSHANANNIKHSRDAAQSQSRSRSLSVSLEQEAAAGLRRTESKPRRVLQREVSMSKVFKSRRNDGLNARPPTTTKVEAEGKTAAAVVQSQATKGPIVLVESTPQKPKAKLSKSKSVPVHRKPS